MTAKAARPTPRAARSCVGRADLVRLWLAWSRARLGQHPIEFDAAAAVLGFGKAPVQISDSDHELDRKMRPIPVGNDSLTPDPPPTPIVTAPLPPATFFLLARRETLDAAAREQALQDPPWLKDAEVLEADGPGEPGARPPRKAPLAAWSRVWPMLRAVLGEIAEGREPDVPRVVQRIGAGQALRRVPMLPRSRWHGEARILADFAARTAPFHRDYALLRDALAHMRGEGGLVLEILDAEPGANPKVRRAGVDSAPYPWRPPATAVPVLVLSDLGLYDPSGPAYAGWVAFGRRLQALGREVAVLCPVPASKIPARLRRLFRIYSWDRNSALKALAGGPGDKTRQLVFDDAVRSAALDVLGLLAPVLVAEPADVRAVRHLLPPGRGTVAVEALLWRNETSAAREGTIEADTAARSQEDRTLDRVIAADQGLYTFDLATLQALRQRWTACQDAALRLQIIHLIRKHHAYWPASMRYAEYDDIDRLLRDAGQDPPAAGQDWLAEDTRDAFEKWKCDMVATVRARADAPGLRRWNHQDIGRQSVEDPSAWARNPQRVARWALAQDAGAESMQLPGGVDVDAVRPFLPRPTTARMRIHVRQRGPHVVLAPAPAIDMISSAEPSTPLPVAELAVAEAIGEHASIEAVETGSDRSNGWILSLRDAAADLPVQLDRRVRSVTIATGAERLLLEGITRERLPWAAHLRRDATGLHAFGPEWCGRPIELLWHGPEGPGTGSWTGGEGDTTFGVDEFGLCADLQLAIVRQRFRWILPGTFSMGSPDEEVGRRDDEVRHQVALTRGFWLADTTVTVGLWNEVMKDEPRDARGHDRRPVTRVSWNDAQAFLHRLEQRVPGMNVGLPTEAEWEYACRAGTQTPYTYGDTLSDRQANIGGGPLRNVASYRPNAWGLFDMHGSVWEWCSDWYGEYGSTNRTDPVGPVARSRRVLRGGSWFLHAALARSARRRASDPGSRDINLGFRLATGRASVGTAELGGVQTKATHTPPRSPRSR